MYKILADDQIIYTDTNNMDKFRLVSPELELADNSSGTLTMTVPPSNIGYDIIQRLTTEIRVFRSDVEIWRGRVLSEEVDFWKNKKMTCEGELGYLNDTLQPQKEFENPTVVEFLDAILKVHNSKVPANKQFKRGAVTVTDKMVNEDSGTDEYYDDIYVYTNFETTLSCITTKLIDNLGGHLQVRWSNGVRYLDYLKDFPGSSEQTIQFGWNLMDFVTNYDETNFCTVLVPLGERYGEGEIDGLEGYLDICDIAESKKAIKVNSSGGISENVLSEIKDYVPNAIYSATKRNYIMNTTAIKNYGWIERVEHFDDITEDTDLIKEGQKFLTDIQFGTMALEVSAVDLAYYDINYDEINLLDEVRVKSIPHGLDRIFPVTQLRIPIDNPGNSEFTLGVEGVTSLSGYSNSITKNLGTIGRDGSLRVSKSRKNSITALAQSNAKEIMDSVTTGYITITTDKVDVFKPDGTASGKKKVGSDAIYISNKADYEVASTKRWKWNLGGLAFETKNTSTGKWNNPKVAITMDGAIVADMITTGTLNADIIKAGKLQTYNFDPDTGVYTKNNNVVFDLLNGTLKINKGEINLGNGQFKVTDAGKVTANDISLKGTIESSIIKMGKIKADGGEGADNYKFYVNKNGEVTAKALTATGTITGSTISGGTITGATIRVGKIDADGGEGNGNYYFVVTSAGNLTAKKLNANGSFTTSNEKTGTKMEFDDGLINGYINNSKTTSISLAEEWTGAEPGNGIAISGYPNIGLSGNLLIRKGHSGDYKTTYNGKVITSISNNETITLNFDDKGRCTNYQNTTLTFPIGFNANERTVINGIIT